MLKFLCILYLITLFNIGECGLTDYFQNVGSYFGFQKNNDGEVQDIYEQKVPYEVSIADEKFISNAIQLNGVAVSELDSCQHRVVLKLHSDCQNMNDEMISKMAVALLNCQSYVEGRKIYPCSEQMSIKDCTSDMDADAWNSYHLMSNRARAVCYSIRQVQFRGITEQTINRLMDAAKNQMRALGRLTEDQENLHSVAQNTLETVTKGQAELLDQARDLQKAHLYGQFAIEDNIKRLGDEKRLIVDSQQQLADMTRGMQIKLAEASKQIENQAKETNVNHKELLDDLIAIQDKTQVIFQRIEDSSKLLIQQSELARRQYESTIKQLTDVNNTVHSLVTLVGGTKQALEERLAWITESLGGTDGAVEKMYLIIWHLSFLLMGMIACAFLGVRMMTRLAVIILVPLNLAFSIYKFDQAMDALILGFVLTAYIIIQTIIIYSYEYLKNRENIPFNALKGSIKKSLSPPKTTTRTPEKTKSIYTNGCLDKTFETPSSSLMHRHIPEDDLYNEEEEETDFCSPTPPLSRSGFYASRSRSRTPLHVNGSFTRSNCKAITRSGTVCKLSSLAGRDYCHRHQAGDSILG